MRSRYAYETIKTIEEMTFLVKDFYYVHEGSAYEPTTKETNGLHLRQTLYDMFPQSNDKTYEMLDFITEIAIYGTTESYEFDAFKCMLTTLHISVSELI